MKKTKDTQYLFLSANIRALQTKMIGTQALQKMISAASPEEAYKTVNDAGIGADIDYKDFESALTQELASTYERLGKASDDPEMFKIFRYKYDGHNLKTLIKAHVSHSDAEPLLSPLGTVDCKTLRNGLRDGDFGDLNPQLALAAVQAMDSLAKANDPQMVDVIIDRAVLDLYEEFSKKPQAPTLQDLYRILQCQKENLAKDIVLASEIFTKGSLNTFAQPTNVQLDNRVLCFNIRDLGQQLRPIGMLVLMEGGHDARDAEPPAWQADVDLF